MLSSLFSICISYEVLLLLLKIKQDIKRIVNPISIDQFNNLEPISKVFGFDRGTPIDRYYMEKFLNENRRFIKGRILEIAEDTYSKKNSLLIIPVNMRF